MKEKTEWSSWFAPFFVCKIREKHGRKKEEK